MARFCWLQLGSSFYRPLHAYAGKARTNDTEKLWRAFFSDPSQWSDHRSEKVNSFFPDFKHKYTQEALWLDDRRNPAWVESEMASLAPSTVQLGKISSREISKPKSRIEDRWRNLFSDPSQWWDNTQEKGNPKFPDFKHKHTEEALWLVDSRNPQWVVSELALLAPGTIQIHPFAWARKLSRCNKAKQYEVTMELFQQMQQEGISADRFVFVSVLNACTGLQALEEGRYVHKLVIEAGCESDLYVSSCLVDMYAKCGSIEDASKVFNRMPQRDVVVWTAMILGHVSCGEGRQALDLFQQMQSDWVEPDSVTFVGLLNACASLKALEEGRRIHELIRESGWEFDSHVGSSLVDMYAKCGSIDDAARVFDKMPVRDVVDWTAMILGYVNCGQGVKALELFRNMEQEGVEPDYVTFLGLLNACASLGALEEGRVVHKQITRSGCESDALVGSSLVNMYAKCGSIDDAWRVFNKMPIRDVVAWTAMILCHSNSAQGLKALELFQQMQSEGVQPDSVTFVVLLNACASIAALEEGRRIHAQIRQSGWESDAHVGSSLVDMYAKSGSIEDALTVFNKMPSPDVVAWTAMIGGYAMHGLANEAVTLFEQMFQKGLEIDDVTFVCLLSACSHGGLVKEGVQYFQSMRSVYGVSPNTEHYTCIVDLLGRAGHLEDALEIVQTMPLDPDPRVWKALLGACRVHGNLEIGECAAKQVMQLDPTNSAGYVLLSNIYAAAGLWDRREMVHRQRLQRGAWKQPGCTWIEMNNEVHTFFVNDGKHPQIEEIHAELDRLAEQIKQAGYVPDTKFALLDQEEETRRDQLWRHSEKLAIAFGLISLPAGAPVLIVKNLRICGDCHSAAKFISKVAGRSITVRDANRFHHFKDGDCSCRDYY